MCQLVDVRGQKDDLQGGVDCHGFWEEGGDCCVGACNFRVVLVDDGRGIDCKGQLECMVRFGMNSSGGPRTQGEACNIDNVLMRCNAACEASCARARERCECPSGRYITTTDDDESDEEWERRSDAETVAKRAYSTFQWEAYQSDGAIYQLSIAWRDLHDGRATTLVDNQYSNVTPDPVYRHDEDDSDYEEITEHLRTVESKLARLHWT